MRIMEILKKVRLSSTDGMIGGVCGGFAEATDTPSWLWRLGFLVLFLLTGIGIIPYLILWWVLPEEL